MRNLSKNNLDIPAMMLFVIVASIGIYFALQALLVGAVMSEATFSAGGSLFVAVVFAWLAFSVGLGDGSLFFAGYLFLSLSFMAAIIIPIAGQVLGGVALLCFAINFWRQRQRR
jgi:hypothetical protein